MREFIDIVESSQDKWPSRYLYHVTPKRNLDSILEHGLVPTKSRGTKAVYLASDSGHAMGYDNHHDQNGESVLLVVDSDQLDKNLLHPDDYDFPDMLNDPDTWENYSWVDSLYMSGQCRYEGIVPPHAIVVKNL